MRLNEIRKQKEVDPDKMDINYIPQTKEEVTKWIYTHLGMIKHWVTPDLEVDISESVHLGGKKIVGKLPIKFRRVDGEFDVSDNMLNSFENFPEQCGRIFVDDNKFTSLVGVDRIKRIVHPKGQCKFNMVRQKIKEGGIGLINIEGLDNFNLSVVVDGEWVIPEPFKIIQKYLGRPNDIYGCQAELIEYGFEEFAKL